MASHSFFKLSGPLDWATWKDGLRDQLSAIDRYAWVISEGVAICPQPVIQVPPFEVAAADIAANNNVPVTELTNEHAMAYYNNLATNTVIHWRRANNLGLQVICASVSTIPFGIILGMDSSLLACLQLDEVYGKLRPDYEKVRTLYYDWSQMRFANDEDPAVFVHCFRQALAYITSAASPTSAIKDSEIGWRFPETKRFINHGAAGWMSCVYQEFVDHVTDQQYQAPDEEGYDDDESITTDSSPDDK
ncbi:hypothetical protein PENANT_c001G10880 [Penicillium antarcticum]|uniref:Uncharacterized protein n=1 Tax=Penicillium antarcticum TaxID=416450 RepID=A0A1V6QND6_9EURO|nr:hypothetical protein PENANT_c001G10880 [Penicillium antarcticum]